MGKGQLSSPSPLLLVPMPFSSPAPPTTSAAAVHSGIAGSPYGPLVAKHDGIGLFLHPQPPPPLAQSLVGGQEVWSLSLSPPPPVSFHLMK